MAANPRERKRNGKKPRKFVRAKTNVEAMRHDMLTPDTDMPRDSGRIYHSNPVVMGCRVVEGIAAPIMVAGGLALAAGMDATEAVKRRMSKKDRMAKLENISVPSCLRHLRVNRPEAFGTSSCRESPLK